LGFECVVEHGVLLFQGAKTLGHALVALTLVVKRAGGSLSTAHAGVPMCAALNDLR
jgi:hypothetical protein